MSEHEIVVASDEWQAVILAWASSKRRLSDSQRTFDAYVDTLLRFRVALAVRHLELDGDPARVQFIAQEWAGMPRQPGKEKLAGTSYNKALAILSSFYQYAVMYHKCSDNPIARIERARVQEYAGAMPIDPVILRRHLFAIPKDNPAGIRDFALLTLAITTGRRVAELRALNIGDIAMTGASALVTWPKAKGGKVMRDELAPAVWLALADHLEMQYGPQWDRMPGATPVWTSLSYNSRGQRITIAGIAFVYHRRLGITKVHASRHTFAHMMEDAGATLSEIQARLGHASAATTGRYLTSLRRDENKHAAGIAARLGMGDDTP